VKGPRQLRAGQVSSGAGFAQMMLPAAHTCRSKLTARSGVHSFADPAPGPGKSSAPSSDRAMLIVTGPLGRHQCDPEVLGIADVTGSRVAGTRYHKRIGVRSNPETRGPPCASRRPGPRPPTWAWVQAYGRGGAGRCGRHGRAAGSPAG
jgi:hypothetical protein